MLLLSSVFTLSLPAHAADLPDKITIKTEKKSQVFRIEVMKSVEERAKGMMFREELAPDRGMLFVFNVVAKQNFWMKNTLIPLDIIFIDETGRIIKVHKMAKPRDEGLIPSGKPVLAVLEIKGGEAEKRGIKAGNRVIYPIFAKTLAKP